VDVSGAGALLDLGNNGLTDGNNGTGRVTVENGGSLVATSSGTGHAAIDIGNQASSVGTLDVDGAATSVHVAGAITVADFGTGIMAVTNGGGSPPPASMSITRAAPAR
jgi:T5SS/PEP-CTERM-associated repeat protein